jgi:hypothetical protein
MADPLRFMKRYILLALLLVPNIALALTPEQGKILFDHCKVQDCKVKLLADHCKAQVITAGNDTRDLFISVRDLNVTCACRANRKMQGLSDGDCPKIYVLDGESLRRGGYELIR